VKSHAIEVEEAGRWYFRRDILGRLDQYFEALRLLRRVDRESFDLYSRIGASLAPGSVEAIDCFADAEGLLSLPKDRLLTGGCVVFKERQILNKWISPIMAIFRKYNRSPSSVEYYSGPLYAFNFVYHSRKYNRLTEAGEFPIAIIHDGGLMLMQQYMCQTQSLPYTGREGYRHGRVSISQSRWGWNPGLKRMCQNHGIKLDVAMQEILDAFARTYALSYHCHADTRVMINKGDLTASFGVDMMRLPYFFSDRARSGNARRKPIFHIVRAHARVLGSVVHSHVRGERNFMWQGYKVHITLPGKHHSSLGDLTFGATTDDDPEVKAGHWIDIRELGVRLARELRT
jgi:hypothetical protein